MRFVEKPVPPITPEKVEKFNKAEEALSTALNPTAQDKELNILSPMVLKYLRDMGQPIDSSNLGIVKGDVVRAAELLRTKADFFSEVASKLEEAANIK